MLQLYCTVSDLTGGAVDFVLFIDVNAPDEAIQNRGIVGHASQLFKRTWPKKYFVISS